MRHSRLNPSPTLVPWYLFLLMATLSIAAYPADAQEPEELEQSDRALAFAECMRENGVPEFPDPDPASGGTRFVVGAGSDDPDSSARRFRAAQEACRGLSPFGAAAGEVDPERIEQLTELAECIRENGVSEWPDPDTDGGFSLRDTDLGINDGRLRAAMETCREALGTEGIGIGIRVTR